MSAESIARWNAIPMTRPEHDGPSTRFSSTKRPRGDDNGEHDQDVRLDGEESDDDMSLVSRSPSPVPQDQMDIDKYDDYVRGPVREVITVDTKIKSTNKGFEILSKLGWVEGQPLGLSQDARIDPLPFHIKNDATGLGKTSQDFRVIETTVAQRRELDSERQRNETEEQRRAREGNVARRAAVQTEISEVLRPFYCNVCDKQFQNVAQYDEHTNSYAHHHKIRFRDMQNTQRAKQNTPEEKDKRKEKERKREEKELRKIAAAAGVRMTKSGPSAAAPPPVAPSTESKPTSSKKGGWASISSATAESSPPRSGWAAVSSSSVLSYSPSLVSDGISASGIFPTTATAPARSSPPRGPPMREQVQDDQRQLHQPAPAFRTGGWSSIDSTTGVPPSPLSPPPPPLAPSDVSVSAAMTDVHSQQEHRPAALVSAPTTSAVITAMATDPSPLPAQLRPQAPIANPDAKGPKPSKSKKEKEAEMREHSRSGWQSFQKGGRRK